MQTKSNSVLILTGMHRSGTSFTTSLLQNAGLDIGQRLIAAGNGNVKGFFENVDFVRFHEAVLRSQNLDEIGWTLEDNIPVKEPYLQQAQEIVCRNSQATIWGWKDPRTALFLDFWAELLPEAKFLFIYRSPWEVVDSLYRRGDEIFVKHPELAVKLWIHYNQKLLNFIDKFPDQCLLVSVYSIVNHTAKFIELINAKFDLNLKTPASNIYERSLLYTQTTDIYRPTLIAYHFPQAINIYLKLNSKESLPGHSPDESLLEQIKTAPDQTWAFQDWIHIRHLEKKVKSLRSELKKRVKVI
ncbi:chromosome segregation ATPase-like protein [Gloeocapsa sp. PCC 7428]|uniref:sulfotransferase family protein n=1 Tax=Gloeocapsa sp. PCC 7428 TaxID=1173026 RepID=UPI0002A609F5|nr:sulfotransferase [Gloeocapsa sp. PCC 7428]AFZ32466.1 chromosome segregation ATPase-like protein [Gloeocapsa sp. PCC 7428]